MIDRNPDAAPSQADADQFASEMSQPLFEGGPLVMDVDDAEALYLQCVQLEVDMNRSDSVYCRSIIALSTVYLHKHQFEKAIPFLLEALRVLKWWLPPCHEHVGAMHYLLASTYQFDEQYDRAIEQWIIVMRCFSWLPDWAPVLREAAEGLVYCRSEQLGMPLSENFCEVLPRRDAA
jgi:tetratricopeptide (TPR) repeat protein